MNRQLKALAVTTLSFAVPLIASLAEARTSAPIPRAHPATAANEQCLIFDNGFFVGTSRWGLRNNCASNLVWQMALPVDAPAAYTVLVRMRDTGVGGLQCTTRVRDAFGNPIFGGSDDLDTNTALDGDEELVITTDAVPAGGTLVLHCQFLGGVANTVKVFGVDWF